VIKPKRWVVYLLIQVSRIASSERRTLVQAVAAMMMEVGTQESVLRDGARVPLPLSSHLASEQLIRDQLRAKLGVDPLDDVSP
jgi:hypothetical protein